MGAGMGTEIELGALLGICVLGTSFFGRFESETPAWRRALKWIIIIALTLVLSRWLGHWSLVVPIALGLVGLIFHFAWCRRNTIHPLNATPRRRYYALRGWEWVE